MVRNINKNRVFRFNRRIRGRTNYNKRLNLLKSKIPRVVIRKSNAGIVVQIVEYEPDADKIITSARAHDLIKLGFTLNTGNIVASYLTGYLAAKRVQLKGFNKECIVDFGLQNSNHYGSRLYAALKGMVDGGVKVRVNEKVFPSEERLNGEHLSSKDVKKIIEKTKKSIEGLKK